MTARRPCLLGCTCRRHTWRQARHGTPSGYEVLHRRKGQPACDECLAAERDWRRASRLRMRSGFTLSMDEAFAELGLTRR